MPTPQSAYQPTSSRPVRGTQSFVHTLSACWRRPSLTVIEVAWRWLFGIPALLLVGSQVRTVLLAATSGTLDPASLGLDQALLADPIGALTADPLGASQKFASALSQVLPGLEHLAFWLLPALAFAWVVVSSLGRTFLLRRPNLLAEQPRLHARPVTLIFLSTLRISVLVLVFWIWYRLVTGSAHIAINTPIAAGNEPNLVLYCALVILSPLGLFTAWAVVSWPLAIAPLLAMLNDTGPAASLRAAFTLGPLRAKLVEINLVLGIVMIALLVLAMVFSATPLPFQNVTTPGFLADWSAGVAVFYLLASDFFHVARLLGYLQLWRAYQNGTPQQ